MPSRTRLPPTSGSTPRLIDKRNRQTFTDFPTTLNQDSVVLHGHARRSRVVQPAHATYWIPPVLIRPTNAHRRHHNAPQRPPLSLQPITHPFMQAGGHRTCPALGDDGPSSPSHSGHIPTRHVLETREIHSVQYGQRPCLKMFASQCSLWRSHAGLALLSLGQSPHADGATLLTSARYGRESSQQLITRAVEHGRWAEPLRNHIPRSHVMRQEHISNTIHLT
jgi:hypothetical protein